MLKYEEDNTNNKSLPEIMTNNIADRLSEDV